MAFVSVSLRTSGKGRKHYIICLGSNHVVLRLVANVNEGYLLVRGERLKRRVQQCFHTGGADTHDPPLYLKIDHFTLPRSYVDRTYFFIQPPQATLAHTSERTRTSTIVKERGLWVIEYIKSTRVLSNFLCSKAETRDRSQRGNKFCPGLLT